MFRFRLRTVLSAAFILATSPSLAAEIKLDRDDLVIAGNATVSAGRYYVADRDEDGVVHVRGNNLVIDFQNAALCGSAAGTLANEFRGRGVVIEDSSDVVLKNARIEGFKIGVYARNCRNLTIQGCDLSENWKQHLLSTPAAENGADWLFGHENDNNEWFRYGAAVYLDGCTGFKLRNNVARRGQNGFCLVRSNGGEVYDNDCSFNSGWGLAMYRSCRNRIAHNKFDWCIRGYSHGVYNRGQDSAGILVFEQCSDNIFAFNSATHGGDGFFLFAGLETLEETGQGGCNRNLVYGNDFSHASNNGIEATFSTGNRFIENTIDQADHAIWAGYSYGSQFVGNKISRCAHGVSIEHGSDNRIELNRFDNNGVAVNLWANEKPGFVDKPYGKAHHCRSEGYTIVGNRFANNRIDVRLARTGNVAFKRNDLQGAAVAIDLAPKSDLAAEENNIGGEVRTTGEGMVRFAGNFFHGQPPAGATSAAEPLTLDFSLADTEASLAGVPGTQNAFLPAGALRGLEYIFVDEWGPYDFEQVKVSPATPVFWGQGELRVLGPPMRYRICDVRGQVDLSALSGELPASLKIGNSSGHSQAFSFTVELPDRNERHAVSGLLLFADWDVKFYGWKGVGPQKPPADWNEVIAGPVLEERRLPRIDFAWGVGAPSDRVPADHFATLATADIELPEGNYLLRTVSDDGIRLSIDGKTVIDNWTWHPPKEDTVVVRLSGGRHAFRIEHFEIDGVAQLQFFLAPAPGEDYQLDTFTRQRLTDTYFSEGANAGDIDGDGRMDVVYGPYWFKGPEFTKRHEIYPAKPQPRDAYADNFFNWVYDFNGDGRNDVFVVGFPGTPAYVYQNPGPEGIGHAWKRHQVFDGVANESPQFINVIGDDKPELVCACDGSYGFAKIDWNEPLAKWAFHPISDKTAPDRFGHGLGVGDINGDGRMDLLTAGGWFEQPKSEAANSRWKFHAVSFTNAYGGADMYAYDVDGDGDNDVITSLAAHHFGLAWYEQYAGPDGPLFRQHLIMGSRADENRYGLVFSELHSVALADIDGDGLKDIVTGKTYWSHHKQSPLWDAGAVVYWFRLVRSDTGVDWVPYLADDDSGIGRQVTVVDIDGDDMPDIVMGGMKGCHVLRHQRSKVAEKAWEAAQPKPRPSVQRVLNERAPIDAANGKVADALEGETLRVINVSAGEVKAQDMSPFANDRWSGAKQLFWAGAKPGAKLDLELSSSAEGEYDVTAVFTMAPDYGIVQVSLDGRQLAKPIDLFNYPSVITSGVLTFGKQKLAAGKHRLTLEIVGANPAAVQSYMVGLDYVRLSSAQ